MRSDDDGSDGVINGVELVRGAYGACQLIAPRLLAGRVLRANMTPTVVTIIRILGARHLVQAAITLPDRTRWLRPLGGFVDLLHALSMLGVAIVAGAHRRAALCDAAVATAFAASELRAHIP